ncbi:MAG: response regulator [Synergistales bacterium]|nr:response regulator [Synergistales bacterium]
MSAESNRFERFFHAVPHAAAIFTREETGGFLLVEANAGFQSLLNLPGGPDRGLSPEGLPRELDWPTLLARTLEEECSFSSSFFCTASGRQLEVTSRPMPPEMVTVGLLDSSRTKTLEDELATYRNRLEGAMRAGNIAWWEMHVPDGSVNANRRKAEMLGYDPDDFTHYTHFTGLIHPGDYERVMQSMRDHLEGKVPRYETTYRIRNADGGYAWLYDIGEITARNALGEPIRVTGVVRDVSRQKAAEQALRDSRDAAEAANRAKSQFVANMSHEIRTPLSGIIGMAELALETELSPAQQEYLADLQNSAHTLLEIINDVLDFSKIESGRMEMAQRGFNPGELVGDAARLFAPQSSYRDIELLCDIDPSLPRQLGGDPLRLRQILLNLIGNAVKFTDTGEILIGARIDQTEAEEAQLTLTVRDTGPGIPQEKTEAIFDAFSQADDSYAREHRGSGLGLAISRKLARMMGGDIQVDSTPGEGSTFTVTAGVTVEDSHPLVPRGTLPEGIRCLLGTRGDTLRRILERQLRHMGAEVVIAESGEEMLRTAAEDRRIGMAVIEQDREGADSTAAETALRRAAGHELPILLAVPARKRMEGYERCAALAACELVSKPFTPGEVMERCATLLGRPQKQQAAAETARPRLDGSGHRLLVAEDDRVNMKFIGKMLHRLHFELVQCEDGETALQELRRGGISLAFVDVHLPNMDGLAVTRQLRREEEETGVHTPVIAITADALESHRQNFYEAGMDAVLVKPFQSEQMEAVLARYLPEQPGGKNPDAPPEDAPEQDETHPLLDLDTLHRRTGDVELAREMLELYTEQTGSLMADLRKSVEAGDHQGAYYYAHTLKGSSANVNADRMYREAVTLMKLAEEKAAAETMERALRKLEAAYNATMEVLEQEESKGS